jgi:branched-chain amino acid transport system substrate-binding protein
MSEMDFRPKAFSLLVAAASQDFYAQLGDKAEGVLCPSHWDHGVHFSKSMAQAEGIPWTGPDQDDFVRLFRAHTADEPMPGYHPAEAGAQVLAYVMAVERADSLDPQKVRAALDSLVFMSFYGRWDIDQTGLQIGHEMIEIQWQNAQRAIVWPRTARTAPPVYPLSGPARE